MAWAPTVTGYDLLYDFTDPDSYTTSGGLISAITNKGSIGAAGDASQGTAGNRPTAAGDNLPNGLIAATFDGGDYLDAATTINQATVTFLVVAKYTNFAALRQTWGSQTANTGVRFGQNVAGRGNIGVAATNSVATNAINAATWYVLTATFADAGNATAFWTNTTANGTPANAGVPNAANLRLGGLAAGGSMLGSVGVLARYPTVLSAADILQLQIDAWPLIAPFPPPAKVLGAGRAAHRAASW